MPFEGWQPGAATIVRRPGVPAPPLRAWFGPRRGCRSGAGWRDRHNTDEVPLRGGERAALLENAYPVSDRRATELRHGKARLDRLGVSHAFEVGAPGLDHDPDRGACCNVQDPSFDEVGVHRCIEPGIVNDVVDVAIRVIVHPACRDGTEMPVVAATGSDFALD